MYCVEAIGQPYNPIAHAVVIEHNQGRSKIY